MFLDDGYIIGREPTTYDEGCEYRREAEPKAAIAEREETRRRFERFIHTIEVAEQRLARRQALAAKRGQVCDVEGCSGDLEAPEACCDACLLAFYVEAQTKAAEPMLNPWTTADGRSFSSDLDAKLQQRWLSEKRQRHADRIATYIQRRGAWTDQAERDFLTQRFAITPDGERALREAEAAEQADKAATRAAVAAARSAAPMFALVENLVAGAAPRRIHSSNPSPETV